jgi:hypothetical protein
VSSLRATFISALQDHLADVLDVVVVHGPKEGVQRDKQLCCVWFVGKRPFARAGIQEENYYRVRLIPLFEQQQGPDTLDAPNADDLVQASEDLEAALQTVLITAGHEFFTVAEVSVDYDRQYVEAQIVAYDENRSSQGG